MSPGIKRMDDCLSIRNGRLFIEECDAVELTRKFGSPIFAVSEDQLRRNIRKFQQSFKAGWTDGPVKLMPAAKASWSHAIQKIIADEGCGCDIYSPGELAVALDSGFDPQYISVNGVPKDDDHLENAIKRGARITLDGLEEIDAVEQIANRLNKTAMVRLRLRPILSGFRKFSHFNPTGPVATDLAAMAYKGGMVYTQAIEIGKRIMKMKNVALVGFHEHHGRHHPSTRYWAEQMKSFAKEMGYVCKALGGYQPREISIGGGFAGRRDPFNAETHYTEPYQLLALHGLSFVLSLFGSRIRYAVIDFLLDMLMEYRPNTNLAPTIEDYAKVCTSTLKEYLPKNGISTQGLMLQMEPGRSLHGDTAVHLTTVKNVKPVDRPIKWNKCILDTTEFWFTGGRYEHHLHDYVIANRADEKKIEKADIIGRSCYGDRLLPFVRVPKNLKAGDIFALLDVGAYQEVSMSNFNAMPRPATFLIRGGSVHLIRKPETLEDVFRRDVVPEHLAS
ncbi:MAG: diaminopimelate decarboxylase family protein [Thermodesulfobacteriota bacterium]